jgi:hypothetical protein
MVNGELSSVNYGPNFCATMKLSLRRTLQLQQFC